MTSNRPDWDVLICGDERDALSHSWFPAKVRTCKEYTALEGLRFRNVYLTNKAIELGSYLLFQILYRSAVMTDGHVLHISDYRENP